MSGLASLRRRVAKLEKQRGLGSPDGHFNSMLTRMGEPRRASESAAFLAYLQLANKQREEHRRKVTPATPPTT